MGFVFSLFVVVEGCVQRVTEFFGELFIVRFRGDGTRRVTEVWVRAVEW